MRGLIEAGSSLGEVRWDAFIFCFLFCSSGSGCVGDIAGGQRIGIDSLPGNKWHSINGWFFTTRSALWCVQSQDLPVQATIYLFNFNFMPELISYIIAATTDHPQSFQRVAYVIIDSKFISSKTAEKAWPCLVQTLSKILIGSDGICLHLYSAPITNWSEWYFFSGSGLHD